MARDLAASRRVRKEKIEGGKMKGEGSQGVKGRGAYKRRILKAKDLTVIFGSETHQHYTNFVFYPPGKFLSRPSECPTRVKREKRERERRGRLKQEKRDVHRMKSRLTNF